MDVPTISLIFAIIFFFLGLRTPTPIRTVAARLLIRLLRLACLLAPLPAQQLKFSVSLQFRVAWLGARVVVVHGDRSRRGGGVWLLAERVRCWHGSINSPAAGGCLAY